MTVHIPSERQITQEAAQVLMKHLSPATATRFWASWQVGEGNYLQTHDQLFIGETVESLYQQIEEYEGKKKG